MERWVPGVLFYSFLGLCFFIPFAMLAYVAKVKRWERFSMVDSDDELREVRNVVNLFENRKDRDKIDEFLESGDKWKRLSSDFLVYEDDESGKVFLVFLDEKRVVEWSPADAEDAGGSLLKACGRLDLLEELKDEDL